jgi:hypothetical protein
MAIFLNNIFQVPVWISDVKHSSPTRWSVQIVSKICTGMFSNWSGMHTASHSSNHCNTITGIYLWQTTCAKPNNKSHKFVKCQFCRTTISGFRHVHEQLFYETLKHRTSFKSAPLSWQICFN